MPILSAVINNQSPISKNGESFDGQQPFVPLITEEFISLNDGTDQATHEYVTGLLLCNSSHTFRHCTCMYMFIIHMLQSHSDLTQA